MHIIVFVVIVAGLIGISIELVNAAFRHPDAAIWVLTVFGTAAAFVAAFVFLPPH